MTECCPACGRMAFVDVAEFFYESRAIEIVSCCDANLEDWLEDMQVWTRQMWVEWIARKTDLKIRNLVIEDGWPNWVLDYGLEIRDIEQRPAFEFIDRFHRHNVAPAGWKFGGGIYNGPDLVAVVTVGRPGSAALQAQGCIEITRVCVNPGLPKGIVWNACSMAYGWACREVKKRLPQRRIITYTLLTEEGTSLKAAGFSRTFLSKGGSWDRPGRPRTDKAPTERKWRWERILEPCPSFVFMAPSGSRSRPRLSPTLLKMQEPLLLEGSAEVSTTPEMSGSAG